MLNNCMFKTSRKQNFITFNLTYCLLQFLDFHFVILHDVSYKYMYNRISAVLWVHMHDGLSTKQLLIIFKIRKSTFWPANFFCNISTYRHNRLHLFIFCKGYIFYIINTFQKPNLKNLSGGLNLSSGSNMVGFTKNCIQCFKI